jgi:internalin A
MDELYSNDGLRRNHMNPIAALRIESAKRKNLTTLDISDLNLIRVPDEIKQINRLQNLYLNNNKIKHIPEFVFDLPYLEILDVRNNSIQHLSPSIKNASKLERIFISGNKLSTVPSSISSLESMEIIDLRDNPLSILPDTMGYLDNSCIVRLNVYAGNLPPELTRQYLLGMNNFFAYLRSQGDAEPSYEAKLVFIGDGLVGKSTCLQRLLTSNFVSCESTHAVKIHQYVLQEADEKSHGQKVLNCWDFGGQDVYKITHQFYYTKHAIYLLFFYPDRKAESADLERWIESVKLQTGSDADLLLVATHSDAATQRAYYIGYPSLQKQFQDLLRDKIEIDSATGSGFDNLKHAISKTAKKIPHFGQRINKKWILAKKELVATGKSWLYKNEWLQICDRVKIPNDQTDSCLSWINYLGVVLHYKNDSYLNNIIICDPEWLTSAVSYIVADKTILKNAGKVSDSEFHDIIINHHDNFKPEYKSEHIPYLHRLMERFDILFSYYSKERFNLVGQLVPEEKPRELTWEINSPLETKFNSTKQIVVPIESELKAVFNFQKQLPGLMARLIVRSHRFSTDKHWSEGVFLESRDGVATALLEFQDFHRIKLNVAVRSKVSCINFFEIIREIIFSVVEDHYEVGRPLVLIPCRNKTASNICPGHFQLDVLERARSKNRQKYTCDICITDQEIDYMLTGFKSPFDNVTEILAEDVRNESSLTHSMQSSAKLTSIDSVGFQEHQRLLRAILKLTQEQHEQISCPRFFNISPLDKKRWKPSHCFQHKYKMTLWCEHEDNRHPEETATFVIDQDKAWWARIGPYVRVIAKTLKYGVPFIGIANELESPIDGSVMENFEYLEAIGRAVSDNLEFGNDPSGLNAGYLELRHFMNILTRDRSPKFGELRLVYDSQGNSLWVCKKHYVEIYNRPLMHVS